MMSSADDRRGDVDFATRCRSFSQFFRRFRFHLSGSAVHRRRRPATLASCCSPTH